MYVFAFGGHKGCDDNERVAESRHSYGRLMMGQVVGLYGDGVTTNEICDPVIKERRSNQKIRERRAPYKRKSHYNMNDDDKRWEEKRTTG